MPHFLRQPRLQKYRNYTYTAFLRHFCSILTDFPIAQRPGILYAYHTLTLNCPYKISRQCSHFCRSRVQKCQNNVFTAFCSILTNFQMTHRPEISYLHSSLFNKNFKSMGHLEVGWYAAKCHKNVILTFLYTAPTKMRALT